MSLLNPESTPVTEAHLGRWLAFSGLFGVMIGFLLFIPPLFDALGENAALVIFPSSILGLAEPQTKLDVVALLAVESISQFVLYGMAGLVIGACIHLVRNLRSRAERRASK